MTTITLLLAASAMRLTTEYMTDPVGIDVERPRLSWKLPSANGPDAVRGQSAYAIASDMWQSGKVESDQTVNVEWGGPKLKTGQRVSWKVKVWDENGRELDWSEPATFTMGVMSPADWKAKWIATDPSMRPDEPMDGCQWITGKQDEKGVVTLKKTFGFDGVGDGEFVELVHAAKPMHEVFVNGKCVSKYKGHVYRWRFFRFRDITKFLVKGENTIEVKVKPWSDDDDGTRAFLGKIAFPDGREIVTDATWTGDEVRSLGGLKEPSFATNLVLRTEIAAPAFEKEFKVKKAVSKATLFVTGAGFYEASLNGEKIGDKVLDPSPTEFDHRILYSTYILDGKLKPGKNTLKVLVGHGWYDIRSIESWDFATCSWRDFPRMIAQLEIEYADGSRETVKSDRTWREVASPLRYDCIREGEIVGPEISLPANLMAAEVPGPAGRLEAENQPPAKVVRTLSPVETREVAPGVWSVKFPENFAGWARLKLVGQQAGDVVEVRYDERSYEECKVGETNGISRAIDNHFVSSSSHRFCSRGQGFQTDRIICGGGEDAYEPRFTYNGFQYLLITGLRQAPKSVVGCVVRTDYPVIDRLVTGDKTMNALLKATRKSYASNFVDGYPTDCPHREKNGWTGDASIASELAQYHCDNTPSYCKFLMNLCDTQNELGDISCIAPCGGWGFVWGNGPAWDSALYVIPWNLYAYREDRRILDRIYPTLVRYLAFAETKANAEGLVQHGLGDWIPIKKMPAVEFTSSCYYLQAHLVGAKIARLRGDLMTALAFEGVAEKTRRSLNAKYYRGNGVYEDGRQSAQAFALAFGLPAPAEIPAVRAKMVEAVEKADYHLDIGLLGSKWLFRELAKAGRADLVYRLLVNPTKSSMVEWLQKSDGGTLWEDWSHGWSRNHIMFGDFYAVAHQYLAGIRLPETAESISAVTDFSSIGFKEVVFEPCVVKELGHVYALVDTPHGVYASNWKVEENGEVRYSFDVPAGGKATIRLPGRPDEVVGPGRWNR